MALSVETIIKPRSDESAVARHLVSSSRTTICSSLTWEWDYQVINQQPPCQTVDAEYTHSLHVVEAINRNSSCLHSACFHQFVLLGRSPITRRTFPREAFPREDAQGYVSARESQRAETYPCASSRGNASRGKDRHVIGPRPSAHLHSACSAQSSDERLLTSGSHLIK